MTLVNAKPFTTDVDFTIPGGDYDEFERANKIVQPGFRVDAFRDGAVFATALPGNCMDESMPIATKFKNIELRALDPVDIIITKIARLGKRDEQDIESCIINFQITQKQIEHRAKDMNCRKRRDLYGQSQNSIGKILQRIMRVAG